MLKRLGAWSFGAAAGGADHPEGPSSVAAPAGTSQAPVAPPRTMLTSPAT